MIKHVFDMHLSICNVSGGETCQTYMNYNLYWYFIEWLPDGTLLNH